MSSATAIRLAQERARIGLVALLIGVQMLLASCGGGGGGSAPNPPAPANVSVTGVVSSGTAEVGVTVTFIDANGTTVTSVPTGATGAYTIPAGAYVFPAVLIANSPSGTIVSVLAPAAALTDGTIATANVTTLTTALAALLTNGQPNNTTALRAVKASDVAAAISALDGLLQNVFAANGVSSTLNPVTDPLTANGSGQDAAIDAVSIIPGANGPTLVLTANAANQAPSVGIVLNSATITTPPAPLPAPPAATTPPSTPKSYLDYVQKALQDCLALSLAQRSTSARCTDVVDPAFKHNGYTNLPAAVADFASTTLSTGTIVALPKTLFFFTSNGQNLAAVRFYYTLNDGTQSSFPMIAQQLATARVLSDGSSVTWDLIGNQQIYDSSVTSRLQRNLALDGAAGDVSAYLSGLIFNFNPDGPNAAGVNSVNVTGPGLPTGGVWLRRNVVCNNGSNMALMGNLPTTPPKSTVPINSATAFYRWDWKAIGSGATVVPGNAGVWAQAPVDATTIPLYAVYTFAPYDASGTALPSFTKYNLSPPTAAAAGAAMAWNTLDPAFVTAFLSPTGAKAAAQASASVAWAANAAAAPAQTVYVGASQSTTTTFAETDGSVHVAPSATSASVAADMAAAAGLSVSCGGSFTPLQATGDQRFVQLRLRDASGLQVVDNAFYNVQTTGTSANALASGAYVNSSYHFDAPGGQPATPAVGQPLATPNGFSSNQLALNLDGAGAFTASGTGNNDGTPVSSVGTVTGTYSVTTTGTANSIVATTPGQPPDTGAVLADGSVAVTAKITSGETPGISVVGKSGSGFSNNSVIGLYTAVSFYNDPATTQGNMVAQGMPMPVPRGFHSQVSVLQADGNGVSTPITQVNNKDGVGVTTTGGAAGTYSVAANGAITLSGTNPIGLTLVGSGELAIGTRASGTPVQILVVVKNGSGMNNASLNGTYVGAGYGFGLLTPQPAAPAPGQVAPVPKGFYSNLLTVTFDGAGNVSASQTRNVDGVVTTSTSTATYSVAPDGTFTIGSVGQGAVSQSGNVIVVGNISGDPGMGVAVRQ